MKIAITLILALLDTEKQPSSLDADLPRKEADNHPRMIICFFYSNSMLNHQIPYNCADLNHQLLR
jgi:hypothetical protein